MKNIQKHGYCSISTILVSILFSTQLYAEQCLPPQQLIEKVYKQYEQSNSKTILQNENKSILKKYLTESLATKIDNDNKCQAKTDLVCNIDFDIITYAQDEPENPRYQFKILNSEKIQVTTTGVSYKNSVIFKFAKENGCMKISDIIYSNRKSLNHLLK